MSKMTVGGTNNGFQNSKSFGSTIVKIEDDFED